METSTFTIRFLDPRDSGFKPNDPASMGYWLELMRSKGAEVESLADGRVIVRCHRQRQLQEIGWTIHHTALARLAEVLEVSGLAEARAAAYSEPPRKRHGK